MDRIARPLRYPGLAVVALVAAALGSWIEGWVALAWLSGLAAFAIGASVASVDSRRPGNWTPAPRP
jgi:hypothetical protein